MKRTYYTRFILFFFILLSSSVYTSAMGMAEDYSAYKEELFPLFEDLINRIYSGETTATEARAEIRLLRDKHDIPYTDESGILDALIDRADERAISYNESVFYCGMLREDRLMDYRRSSSGRDLGVQLQELAALLENSMTADSADPLSVLNNYYDILGIEYDEGYYRLERIIRSFQDGDLTSDQLLAGVETVRRDAEYAQKQLEKKQRDEYGEPRYQDRADTGQGETSQPGDSGTGGAAVSGQGEADHGQPGSDQGQPAQSGGPGNRR